jgi:hypothetical protein
MRDSSDFTGAAVQVRLEGPLFAELENWRRAQPKIAPARGRSGNCLSEHWPTIDALARSCTGDPR